MELVSWCFEPDNHEGLDDDDDDDDDNLWSANISMLQQHAQCS